MNRREKAAFESMVVAVVTESYQRVGKRLVKESKAQQKEINKQLVNRLDLWDKDVKERVTTLVDKELVPIIQKIVKLEVAKNK